MTYHRSTSLSIWKYESIDTVGVYLMPHAQRTVLARLVFLCQLIKG